MAVRSIRLFGDPVLKSVCDPAVPAAGGFDDGVRALVADALASPESLAASGVGFQTALLEEMSRDPYAAVRYITARSLRRIASSPASSRAWTAAERATLALDADGRLDPERLRALLAARDERAITIAE